MMPRSGLPISALLTGAVSAYSFKRRVRSSTIGWRFFAFPGIMTYFAIFFSYCFTGTQRSEVSVTDWECATLVHILSRTGVSNFSEISYARRANSSASCESDGSSIGTLAAIA